MSVNESIIIGVVSGILTSLIIGIVSVFLQRVILPWYRELIYKGIVIEGEWLSEHTTPSGNRLSIVMQLSQKAENIQGNMSLTKAISGKEKTEIKNYKFKGEISDRFICFSAKNINRKKIGIHIELLELVGSGDTMKGYRSWYSVTGQHIQSDEIQWQRA